MTDFDTFRIDGMGGPIAAGCPSADSAIAVAVDMVRYTETWDDDLGDYVERRAAVVVERDAIPVGVDCDELYPSHVAFVYAEGDARGTAVHVGSERRCGCCSQRLARQS